MDHGITNFSMGINMSILVTFITVLWVMPLE